MKRFLRSLKAFAEHPATQLVTGLILLFSGVSEVISEFRDAEKQFQLGAHHGIAVYGLIQVVGSVPNLVDGIAKFFGSIDRPEGESDEAGP